VRIFIVAGQWKCNLPDEHHAVSNQETFAFVNMCCRLHLICETVDVWSTFANEGQLQNFVMVLLRARKACAQEDAKKFHHSGEEAGYMGDEYREVDLDAITGDILKNLEFYEIEVG